MASEFYMPDWAFAPPSPPEPPEMPSANSLSIPTEAYGASGALALIEPGQQLAPEFWDEADRANAARVDDLNNDFIEQQRQILRTGDDAFFNRTGHDALLAAPEVHAKLDALREETIGRAANDVQREWLKDTLGKHKIVEHFDIGDHVGRQSVAWQKAVNRRRLDNLEQQAADDHAIPGAVEALANASESSARDHARASGLRPDSPEAQAEVDIARSSIFRHAIEGALAKGAHSAAIKLHERAKGKLVPGDAELLDKAIEAARETKIGKDYVAKIAPLSLTINASLEDLDKAQDEATAKNNEDWKDNDKQRAANQHFINVRFGKAKRQVEADKAKLAETVHDWLTTPGPDGLLQTERPPFVIWGKLKPEEREDVDTILETNARGSTFTGDHNLNIILAKTPLEQMQEQEEEKQRSEVRQRERLNKELEPNGTRNRLRIKRIDNRQNPDQVDIQWELDRPSATGGFIVQQIERIARTGKPYVYWEAWPVRPGYRTPPRATESAWDDTFRFHDKADPNIKDGLRGLRTIGTARFYEGMTEAELRRKGFTVGEVEGAGTDQLSINKKNPDLPTDNATPGVIREWRPGSS